MTSRTEEAAPAALSPLRRRTVVGCILAAAMTILDLAMTSIVLGGMQADLDSSLDKGALVISAYATAELVTLSLSAFLTRVFRPRTYLVLLVCVFVAGALASAAAWDFQSLLVARVVQGVASGAIMPFAYYAIVVLLPGDERPRAISTFSIMVTGSYLLAPILSMTLAEWFGWRALYCVAVPAGVLALWLALPGLRDLRTDASPLPRKVNVLSVAAAVAGLFCAQYALDAGPGLGWFSSAVVVLAVGVALTAFVVFVTTELRTRHPLVDLRLLGERSFLASCVFNVVAGAAVYSAYVFIPIYLTTLGYSVGEIGTVTLYGGMVQLVIAFSLPVLLRRVDTSLVAGTGAAVFAVAALLPFLAGDAPPYAVIVLALMARSVGAGLLLAALGLMATRALRADQASSGSLLFNMARSLGGSVGAACCAAFLVVREAHHANRAMALNDVLAAAFVLLLLLAVAFAAGYVRRKAR